MNLDYVVRPISELDGHYLQYQVWTRELDAATLASGTVCQAFNEEDRQVGVLAIDVVGKILVVEVEPASRRRGIATQMLAELEAAGFSIEHDWENMRDDGEVWARSFGAAPPATGAETGATDG